jgi:DNA-binding FadR family transcriptional regulator
VTTVPRDDHKANDVAPAPAPELLDSKTLLEAHQVRRVLEPFATGLAATRLTETDFAELADILERMERANTTQAFIDGELSRPHAARDVRLRSIRPGRSPP